MPIHIVDADDDFDDGDDGAHDADDADDDIENDFDPVVNGDDGTLTRCHRRLVRRGSGFII